MWGQPPSAVRRAKLDRLLMADRNTDPRRSLGSHRRDCALIFDMHRTQEFFLIFRLAFFVAIFWALSASGFAQRATPPDAPAAQPHAGPEFLYVPR